MEILFKKLFIYSICIFLINSLQAQKPTLNVKVTKSDEQKIGRTGFFKVETTEIYGFSPDEQNNYHLLKSEPNAGSKYKSLIMDTYNSNLELVKSTPIDMPAEADTYLTLEGLFQVNNKPLFFYSQYNKSREVRTLYYQSGVLKDKKSAKKLLEFSSTDKDKGNYVPYFSNDSTKIMIVVEPPQKSKENLTMKCYVYDNEMNKINDYDIDFEMRKSKITSIQYLVTNKGIPIVFVGTFKKGKSNEFGSIDENLYLYNSKTPLKYNLEVAYKAISQLLIGKEEENEISLVGTFKHSEYDEGLLTWEGGNFYKPQGTVFLKLDTKTGEIKIKKLEYFSDPVLEFFEITPKGLTKGKGLDLGQAKFVGVAKNNNTFLAIDINYVSLITKGMTQDFHYFNKSKVIVSFNPEGKIIFERVIPNFAQSDTYKGVPTQVFLNNNEVGIIYNTHEANLPIPGNRPIKTVDDIKQLKLHGIFRSSSSSNLINLAYIDETGRVTHHPLTDFKTEKMNLANVPAYCKNNKVVFATFDTNGFKVIQAELDYKK